MKCCIITATEGHLDQSNDRRTPNQSLQETLIERRRQYHVIETAGSHPQSAGMQNRRRRAGGHCKGIGNDSYRYPRRSGTLPAPKCRQAFVYAHAGYVGERKLDFLRDLAWAKTRKITPKPSCWFIALVRSEHEIYPIFPVRDRVLIGFPSFFLPPTPLYYRIPNPLWTVRMLKIDCFPSLPRKTHWLPGNDAFAIRRSRCAHVVYQFVKKRHELQKQVHRGTISLYDW